VGEEASGGPGVGDEGVVPGAHGGHPNPVSVGLEEGPQPPRGGAPYHHLPGWGRGRGEEPEEEGFRHQGKRLRLHQRHLPLVPPPIGQAGGCGHHIGPAHPPEVNALEGPGGGAQAYALGESEENVVPT